MYQLLSIFCVSVHMVKMLVLYWAISVHHAQHVCGRHYCTHNLVTSSDSNIKLYIHSRFSCFLILWASISFQVLTTLPYGNSRLSVWGHLDNTNRTPDKKQYFVLPVVMLLPKTAFCRQNVFTESTALSFKVAMWYDDIARAALLHLRKVEPTCMNCLPLWQMCQFSYDTVVSVVDD